MLAYGEYLMPTSIREALAMVTQHADHYQLLSGGTDLIPAAREVRGGNSDSVALIDLSRIRELRESKMVDRTLRIGAAVTFENFLEEPLFKEYAPLLGKCAMVVADDQIRHEATIGGNIMNASPAADGTVALLTLNAKVVLERLKNGRRESRNVSLSDFVLGPGLTEKGTDEILTGILCDAGGAEFGSAFYKVGHRRSLIISVASTAAVVRLSEDKQFFTDVRLAIGAVSSVPTRLPECEEVLLGAPVSVRVIQRAAAMARDRVASRSRQAYRRDVVSAFIGHALADAVQELGAHVLEV